MFQNFGSENSHMILCKKMICSGCLVFIFFIAAAQPTVSASMLKPMRGPVAAFSSFTTKDSLILICFWSVSSDESISELNAVNEKFENWKAGVKFKLMAVSIEKGKLADRVRPTAIMNGWTFAVFVDINGELQNALNSTYLPQSYIIKNGNVVYKQSGYNSGAENYLYNKLVEFSNRK
jgi:hypothetical protein